MIAPTRQRKRFFTPNAETAILERWKNDGRVKAIGLLTCAGGLLSGKDLAMYLGISPRGLRQFLTGDDLILPEIRDSEDGSRRGETWYRLNHAALPAPGSGRLCIGMARATEGQSNIPNLATE